MRIWPPQPYEGFQAPDKLLFWDTECSLVNNQPDQNFSNSETFASALMQPCVSFTLVVSGGPIGENYKQIVMDYFRIYLVDVHRERERGNQVVISQVLRHTTDNARDQLHLAAATPFSVGHIQERFVCFASQLIGRLSETCDVYPSLRTHVEFTDWRQTANSTVRYAVPRSCVLSHITLEVATLHVPTMASASVLYNEDIESPLPDIIFDEFDFITESKGKNKKDKRGSRFVRFQPAQKAVLDPNSGRKPDDHVFEDTKFEGFDLQPHLLNLQIRDIPNILVRFSTTKLDGEAKRQLGEAKCNWQKHEFGFKMLQRFLVFNYNECHEKQMVAQHFELPNGCICIDDNSIFMPSLDKDLLEEAVNKVEEKRKQKLQQQKEKAEKKMKKKKSKKSKKDDDKNSDEEFVNPNACNTEDYIPIPVEAWYNSTPNVLYDIFSFVRPRQCLTPQILKCILRTLLQKNSSLDDILQILKSKCFLPRKPEEFVRKKLYWCACYIPAEWYFVNIPNEHNSKFYKMFAFALNGLYDKIIAFAKQYVAIGNMNSLERTEYFNARKQVIANYLRKPENQAKFLRGQEKDDIVNDLLKSDKLKIDKLTTKSQSYASVRTLKIRDRENIIHTNRAIKHRPTYVLDDYDSNYVDEQAYDIGFAVPEFETHSLGFSISFSNIYFKGSLSALIGVLGSLGVYVCYEKYKRKFITNYANVSNIVEKVSSIANTISDYADKTAETVNSVFENFSIHDPNTKIMFVEIKSVIHILFYLYRGDFSSALAWTTNFLCTRADQLVNLINMLAPNSVSEYFDTAKDVYYDVKVDGMTITLVVSDDDINRMIAKAPPAIQKSLILEHGSEVGQFVAQSLEQVTGFLASIIGFARSTKMEKKDIIDANAQFQYIRNVRGAIDDGWKGITSFISLVCRYVFYFDPFDDGFNDYAAKVTALHAEVSDYQTRSLEIGKDREILNRILQLHKDNLELIVHPQFFKCVSPLRTLVLNTNATLEKLAPIARELLNGTYERNEPLLICFIGKAGIGKSSAIRLLASTLSAKIYKKQYHPEMAYVYNSNSDFWEGYLNQPFVIMDDVLGTTDIDTRRRETADIKRMVNTIPANLNMAFGLKGVKYFNSDFIFMSSNSGENGYDATIWNTGHVSDDFFKRRLGLVLWAEERFNGDDILNTRFRIDKCELIPELRGQWKTCKEIVYIVLDLYNRIQIMNMGKNYTQDDVANMFPDLFPERQQVVVESKEDYIPNMSIVEKYFGDISKPYYYVEYLLKLFNQNKYIKYGSALLAMMMTFVGTYKLYKFFTDKTVPVISEAYNRKGKTGNNGKKVAYVRTLQLRPLEPQSSTDAYYNCLAQTIVHCTFMICARNSETQQTATGFHIKDRLVAVPAHFYMPIEDGENQECYVIIRGVKKTIPWPSGKQVFQVEGEDMILFLLPKGINLPKSSYEYIVNQVDIQQLGVSTPLELVNPDENGRPCIKKVASATSRDTVEYASCNTTFTVYCPVAYTGNTQAGDSGSVVCYAGPQGRPRIIGMHVGKMTRNCSIGIAIPFYREFFDLALEAFSSEFLTESKIVENFPHTVLYTVPITKAHYPPFHSRIRKSPLYKWFSKTLVQKPAYLRSPEGCPCVIDLALRKLHQIETPRVDYDEDQVDQFLRNHYPRKGTREVVSYDEALRGDPAKGSLGICYQTSGGYPASLERKKGKQMFLVQRADLSYDYKPEALKKIQDLELELLKGNNIEVIYADVLKDETRPVEKVDAFKTRLFSTCPFEYLILVRRYFLDFVTYVQKLCVHKAVSVGINVHSVEWTFLHDRLSQTVVNGSVIAGDFSNFDGKLPKYIGLHVIRFINWWYDDGPENARVRELLAEHIYNATHIIFDKVYQVVDGNPSGNPITTIYNSMCNLIMCYIILKEDFCLLDRSFQLAIYGDDNIITIRKPNLRCSNFTPHFKRRFDLDYTHFSKQESDVFDTLYTIRYLGREFVRDPKYPIYRAPLKLTTILESVYWVSGDERVELIILDTCRSFFNELSHFDQDTFDEYSRLLLVGIHNRCPSIEDAVRIEKKTYNEYTRLKYYAEEESVVFDESLFVGITKCKSVSEAIQQDPVDNTRYEISDVIVESKQLDMCFNNNFVVQSRDSKPYVKSQPEKTTSDSTPSTNERNVVEPVSTQQVQLGAYLDASQITSTSVDATIKQNVYRQTNMETFSLDRVLNREYPIATVTWNGTHIMNATLLTIQHPESLLAIPFISDKVKNFRFARFGMRISVRIVCNKFCYGKLMLSFKPMPDTDKFFNLEQANIFRTSGDPHVLISASAGETAVFDCPFISPKRALDLQNHLPDEIGVFILKVLNPLESVSDEIPSAQVFVTAQFLETDLFLPSDTFLTESKQEQIVKSKEGVISSSLEQFDSVMAGLETVPFARSYANTFRTISKPIHSLAKVFGLSKPTTLDTAQLIKVNPFSDMANGKGIDLTPNLGMDPENRITTIPSVGGITQDEMDLKYIFGTPKLVAVAPLEANGEYELPIGITNTSDMTFVEAIANNFRYFSGSFKFKLYFTASVMQSARVVVFLAENVVDDWAVCYHDIIEVTGDTEYEVTIPYLSDTFIQRVDQLSIYNLCFKVVGWSQPTQSITCPIYMNIYMAGADDFRVYGQIERQYTFATESNPRADFSRPFKPIHPSIVSYVPENLVIGEEFKSLREMIHKYYPYNTTVNSTQQRVYRSEGILGDSMYIGLEMLCMIFAFYSGSIRMKFIQKNNTTGAAVMTFGNTNNYFVGTSISSTMNPLVEATLPFYDNLAFVSTRSQNPRIYGLNFDDNSSNNKFQFKAAGDDFTTHFLCAFPPGTYGNSNTSVGYSSFLVWL